MLNAVQAPTGIFGVKLQDSIKYANVAISLTNEQGESFIYGYVPIVVAKCGVFLKEKGNTLDGCLPYFLLILHLATDVEGIFRLSGSAKRIKELQAIFDSPDRYGKGLDWTGYTVHDAANILRRYLNQLPQPIVPLDFYERFREPLRSHQAQAVGDMEAQAQDIGDFDQEKAITTFQQLITELPPLNRQLLLYILDLLAVFASKSDLNRMTSANLAAIFQPGMLSHPTHDMSPQEYRLSQDVLIFLIENQDSFLIGMNGTAADEKTVKEVESGIKSRQSSTPSAKGASQSGLGRSASNASAGADSLRRFGGIRRNVSVSSKNSKASANVPSPVTPSSGTAFASNNTGSGVHRSNTLPSKKSPGLSSARFQRPGESPSSTSAALSPGLLSSSIRATSPGSRLAPSASEGRTASNASSITPTAEHPPGLAPVGESTVRDQSEERLLPGDNIKLQPPPPGFDSQQSSETPAKERKVSNLFTKSPTSDGERKEMRQPNKLKKKRIPGSANPSAQSSANSLHYAPDSPGNQAFYTPLPTPGLGMQLQADPLSSATPTVSNTAPTPSSEVPHYTGDGTQEATHLQTHDASPPRNGSTLQTNRSPNHSLHSRSSVTDHSDGDHIDDATAKIEDAPKQRRWRFSSSAKKNGQVSAALASAPTQIGSNAIADHSTSTVGSFGRPRKSMNSDSHQHGSEPSSIGFPSTSSVLQPSNDKDFSSQKEASQEVPEKKGPIGWFKAKVAQAKEDRKEREAEKERAKTPPRNSGDRSGSKHSLSAIAQEGIPIRGRSMDVKSHDRVENGAETPTPG